MKDRVKAKANPKALHQVQVKMKVHHKVRMVLEKVLVEKAKEKVEHQAHLLVLDKMKALLWTVMSLERVKDRAKAKEAAAVQEKEKERLKDNLHHLMNQVLPLEGPEMMIPLY